MKNCYKYIAFAIISILPNIASANICFSTNDAKILAEAFEEAFGKNKQDAYELFKKEYNNKEDCLAEDSMTYICKYAHNLKFDCGRFWGNIVKKVVNSLPNNAAMVAKGYNEFSTGDPNFVACETLFYDDGGYRDGFGDHGMYPYPEECKGMKKGDWWAKANTKEYKGTSICSETRAPYDMYIGKNEEVSKNTGQNCWCKKNGSVDWVANALGAEGDFISSKIPDRFAGDAFGCQQYCASNCAFRLVSEPVFVAAFEGEKSMTDTLAMQDAVVSDGGIDYSKCMEFKDEGRMVSYDGNAKICHIVDNNRIVEEEVFRRVGLNGLDSPYAEGLGCSASVANYLSLSNSREGRVAEFPCYSSRGKEEEFKINVRVTFTNMISLEKHLEEQCRKSKDCSCKANGKCEKRIYDTVFVENLNQAVELDDVAQRFFDFKGQYEGNLESISDNYHGISGPARRCADDKTKYCITDHNITFKFYDVQLVER